MVTYDLEETDILIDTVNPNILLIHKMIPGRQIVPELAFTGIDGEDTYAFTADFPGIMQGSFELSFTDTGTASTKTLRDDSRGRLVYEGLDPNVHGFSGTIDYTTGEVEVVTLTNLLTFTIADAAEVYFKYKTSEAKPFNKVEVLNSSAAVVLTGTFTDINFTRITQHLTLQLAVDLTIT
jgi:hypothetical protein